MLLTIYLINRYAESGMFFSMVYGILSPEEGAILYVNAGHPPPLLFRKDGSYEELERTGSIIGYKRYRVYRKASVDIQKGDILLCYTDGVTEPQNYEGNLFGKERLIHLVQTIKSASAEDIAHSILEEIRIFTKDAPQYDDITLLILKRT
ncbi:MAG: serine/threonine-protein phosphatase [Methanospirillaceae archaeon]|nr:serine/threonine-protein phosphatase [Methanospirillaceae archaeon]